MQIRVVGQRAEHGQSRASRYPVAVTFCFAISGRMANNVDVAIVVGRSDWRNGFSRVVARSSV